MKFDYHYDGRITDISFSIESTTTSVKLSIQTLMEEINPKVFEKKNVWISFKITIKSSSYTFMTLDIQIQGAKWILLRWYDTPRVKTIQLRPRLKLKTCILIKSLVSKSKKFSTNRVFWRYLNVDIPEQYDAVDIFSKKTFPAFG